MTVLATETIRGVKGTGAVTAEFRHCLSSSTKTPEVLAQAIRRHWAIENGEHWVLDVTFGEDRSRVRDRGAARNLALLRRIALDLLRAEASLKASLKGRRKTAAWDDAYMARLLKGLTRLMRLPWLQPSGQATPSSSTTSPPTRAR